MIACHGCCSFRCSIGLLLELYMECMCLLLSVWFFFFKQKTAYEMRISDWSSDVCSSDLGLPENDPRRVRDQDANSGATSGPRAVGNRRKIGRASCRERVCQYV